MAQSPAPGASVAAPAAEEDPYRHFEDLADPRTQAFFREQSARAREALEAIPGRAALLARIRALSEAETTVSAFRPGGTRVFYLKLAPGRASEALYVREGLGGAERLLFDPQAAARGTASVAITGFSPAPDGRHVAVGVAEGGAEAARVRVLAVDGARLLPFEIDRARDTGAIAWHPDGRSFFYARAPETGAQRAGVRLYRHVLGRATDADEIVYAPGVGGARDVPASLVAALHLPLESRYAYAVAREGLRRELVVHATELRDLAAGRPRWRKLAGVEDEVLAIQGFRGDLFVLSKLRAPRHRVLRLRGDARDLSAARVVVPEGESVIQSMALARDALYLRTMVGGVDRLERVALGLLGAKAPEFVRIPFDNAIAQMEASPRAEGVTLRLQGWIEPPVILQVDRQGELRKSTLQPASAASFGEMDEVRLYAPGHDGVRIPVTLVYAKATRLTGENPTLLLAYGAYGEGVPPAYDAARLAWLERGGVIAVAHVRGGGEYGESWHAGGRRGAKLNSVLDTVAVARFVASYGFTNPRRLVGVATGAGAIAVGGAMARHPELFAAVALRAPLADMVRAEQGAEGAASVHEFGSAASAEGLATLRAISAYHQLDASRAHPAVLLSVGMNDTRVDPWHAAKLAARLQGAPAAARPVLLRADFDAGHFPPASRRQRDEERADVYAFALWQMGEPGFQPVPPAPPAPPAPPQPPPATPAVEAPPKEVPPKEAPPAAAPSGDARNPNPERPVAPR